MQYKDYLQSLRSSGNLRAIPPAAESRPGATDLTGNDYMGFALRADWRREFLLEAAERALPLSSSASRLLAAAPVQAVYAALEETLCNFTGCRRTILFNSGYHANTGLVSALADPADTVILADRLVHASIIDGIRLSTTPFERWRHNDVEHLRRLAARHSGKRLIVVAEGVYSMDGDMAPLRELAALRRECPDMILYVDEAHSLGVIGPQGRGVAHLYGVAEDVDVLVGTFGKAFASEGAFAAFRSDELADVVVNRARSLIFSTALSPLSVAWTELVLRRSLSCDAERARLAALARRMAERLGPELCPRPECASHIIPVVVGDAARVVEASRRLLEREGVKALPIRTPTVPPGTERLRLSLSAALTEEEVDYAAESIRRVLGL